jgi:hypothetical protein
MSDLLLGAALGLIAGVTWQVVFLRVWRFGWMLLGPEPAVEVYVPDDQASMRTVGRALLAMVAAGAVSVAIILGLSLPAGRLVETWARFRWAWIIAFAAGAFIARIIGGRHAV